MEIKKLEIDGKDMTSNLQVANNILKRLLCLLYPKRSQYDAGRTVGKCKRELEIALRIWPVDQIPMEKAAQWVWQLEVQSQDLKAGGEYQSLESISEIPQSGRKEAFMSIIGQIDVEEYKWGDGGIVIIMGWAISTKRKSAWKCVS